MVLSHRWRLQFRDRQADQFAELSTSGHLFANPGAQKRVALAERYGGVCVGVRVEILLGASTEKFVAVVYAETILNTRAL